jgi:hypothetical protein
MEDNQDKKLLKCSRCRSTKLEKYFSINKKGEYKKTCDKCLEGFKKKRKDPKYKEYQKNYNKKYQKKYQEENKERILEQRKCEHNSDKHQCKICTDPIKVTITNWIGGSREADKKHNRYDPVKFIDKCFLEGLVDDSDKKCVYCRCEMHFLERDKNLCTIERIDNELGHNKDNVTLACFGCNTERNNFHTFEEFISIKQLQISEV